MREDSTPRRLLPDTLAALGRPRRALPILAVCAPLCWAQTRFSDAEGALGLGVLMCLAFVGLAPWAWRRLVVHGPPSWPVALRTLAYVLFGASVVAISGALIPEALGLGSTFMTGREALLVSTALFAVGGWGLARDIELERSLVGARRAAQAAKREAEAAQLIALRSHLDPHFLFNTLNALAEWCRTDPETAEEALLRLSALLRTVLDGVRLPTWSLQRELDLVRDLLDLHAVRDPARFRSLVECDEDLESVHVPPMILLPLVENAIKHGPASGHEGVVRLVVDRCAGGVVVCIDNPGVYAGPREGGEGLPLVRRRLLLAYGEDLLCIGAHASGTRALLDLPTRPLVAEAA